MREALAEAEKAHQAGEVPVGELLSIKKAESSAEVITWWLPVMIRADTLKSLPLGMLLKILKTIDSDNCAIYVTLEPCPMCSGAIIGARLTRLVTGPKTKKREPSKCV